ncbi:MAG: OmpA family protein [Alphaproteobacteria bacterium]|jgi:outer membrane protein OmpA-like peptidoglycan-associated protein|nr:OmpA family protein [Alphaproteobacteria bacterium]
MKRLAPFLLFLALGCVTGPVAAVADEPSTEEIVRSLMPEPRTRSLRGVDVEGGSEPAGPPSIDLQVQFAYDSAALGTDAQLVLQHLGEALSDPRLAEYSFVIAGHTDARGSDAYNLDLSQRRANTVRDFLAARYGIARTRMMALGHGETQLADPGNPDAAINRRVQVVNIGGNDG